MADISREIVISLILLLTLLFFILLSNRIYTQRRIRIQNLLTPSHDPESPPTFTSTSSTHPHTPTPTNWRQVQVPGTITRSASGGPGSGPAHIHLLRFTPSPGGNVVVTIPFGAGVADWTGGTPITRGNGNGNGTAAGPVNTIREWEDTPSVWGIDLGSPGTRGRRLRGGAAGSVPAPGAVVVNSTTRGPGRWGSRRSRWGGDEEDGGRGAVHVRRSRERDGDGDGEEVDVLPRYEEPPPGYEKVVGEDAERRGGGGAADGDGDGDGGGAGIQGQGQGQGQGNAGSVPVPVAIGGGIAISMPAPPEPAVTVARER